MKITRRAFRISKVAYPPIGKRVVTAATKLSGSRTYKDPVAAKVFSAPLTSQKDRQAKVARALARASKATGIFEGRGAK